MERKLLKNPDLHARYNAPINEHVKLRHHLPAPSEQPDKFVNYLPHYGVIKETSTSTKLRVVYDASAKAASGICLNEILETGPTIQESLFSILI